jgi:hypothetical protein
MKAIKLAVLAALALAFAGTVQAQQTNVVQNLNIQLFGFSQGGTSSFGSTVTTNANLAQVGNRQIIQALGTATGNTFSPASRLVVVTPLGGGNTTVQVRDGSNSPVDVTQFFILEPLSGSINTGIANTRTGRSTGVSYEVLHVALQDSGDTTLNLHFDVDGIATVNSTSTPNTVPSSTVDANVSGSGDRNGGLLILQGSVDIFGRTLEVGFNTGVS